MDGFSKIDSKYRRVTGLNFEESSGAAKYDYERYIDVVVRPILGDRQGVDAVDGTLLFNISKSLTGNGRYNGVEDGWIDIRN
eukprot:2207901-Amphidinium_carterae.1